MRGWWILGFYSPASMFGKVYNNSAKVKYTRYILSDKPIDFDGIGVMALPAAVMAIPFMTMMLGGAVLMDGGRYLKLLYLLKVKQRQRLNYIRCVLRSLDHGVTKENINLLKTA